MRRDHPITAAAAATAVVVAAVTVFSVAWAASGKTTNLTVWAWPTADQALRVIAPAFEKLNPGVTVKVVTTSQGDVWTKLITTMAAGTGSPDVTAVEIQQIADLRPRKGLLVDLTAAPYFAGKLKDDFVGYKWDQGMEKGRLVALPWDIGPVGLFYRRDMFEKAGLPSDPALVEASLDSWDTYTEWCRKLTTDSNGDGKPDVFGTANAEEILTVTQQQNGCQILDDDNHVLVGTTKLDAYVASLKTAALIRKAKVEAKTWVWNSDIGRFASTATGAWALGTIMKAAPKTAGHWGAAAIPGKDGANWGGSFLAMPGGCKNKALAWKFMKYACATSEAQNAMYRSEGIFPAYKPAWTDAMYDEPVSFFANQPARRLFARVALSTPYVRIYAHDADLKGFIQTEALRCLNQGKDPMQAMQDAAKAIARFVAAMPKR